MLVINTIQEFYALTQEAQQEILRGLRTKDRLDRYLDGLNKAPKVAPFWEECRGCDKGACKRCHPDQPGWRWNQPKYRDNSDIHPSQIDKCVKYLTLCCSGFAENHEEKIPPKLRMIFGLGHAWHDTIQRMGKDGAWGAPDSYRPEVPIDPNAVCADGTPALPVAASNWIKGSADAVIDRYELTTPSLGPVCIRIIHEYKTINSNGYSKLIRPKPEHKKQATIYAAVFDIPIVVYLYTNKDTCDMADFPVPFDYSIWAEIVAKVNDVQKYTTLGEEIPWDKTSAILSPSECAQCGLRSTCNPPVTTKR